MHPDHDDLANSRQGARAVVLEFYSYSRARRLVKERKYLCESNMRGEGGVSVETRDRYHPRMVSEVWSVD